MTWRTWTVFATLCVIWGVPYFFIKLAVAELSPACVAFARVALGAAILLPVAWKRGALCLPLWHTEVRFARSQSPNWSCRSSLSRLASAGSAPRWQAF